MEVFSVVLIVLSGIAISSAYGRLFLNWGYDAISMATAIVIFGVVGMAFLNFIALGLTGAVLTFLSAFVLTLIFVKFHWNNISCDCKVWNIFGRIYWVVLLGLYSFTFLKAWVIAQQVSQIYSLDKKDALVFSLCVFFLAGGISVFMIIYESKYQKNS